MRHSALDHVSHRPWPLPAEPWTWRQSWLELLFAHWPVPVEIVAPLVPERIRVQQWDGRAWLGVVPFRMIGVMRRPLPDIPGVSAFPELNLRTYVELSEPGDGEPRPGVWFFSLDASKALAVWGARLLFHLPYFLARVEHHRIDDRIEFSSSRRGGRSRLELRYRPTSDVFSAQPGTFDHWLTERYCMYSHADDGSLLRCDVHHPPWPLQQAEAEIIRNDLITPWREVVDREAPILHYSAGVHTILWQPLTV